VGAAIAAVGCTWGLAGTNAVSRAGSSNEDRTKHTSCSVAASCAAGTNCTSYRLGCIPCIRGRGVGSLFVLDCKQRSCAGHTGFPSNFSAPNACVYSDFCLVTGALVGSFDAGGGVGCRRDHQAMQAIGTCVLVVSIEIELRGPRLTAETGLLGSLGTTRIGTGCKGGLLTDAKLVGCVTSTNPAC